MAVSELLNKHDELTSEFVDGVVNVNRNGNFMFSFIAVDENDADLTFIKNNFGEMIDTVLRDEALSRMH